MILVYGTAFLDVIENAIVEMASETLKGKFLVKQNLEVWQVSAQKQSKDKESFMCCFYVLMLGDHILRKPAWV